MKINIKLFTICLLVLLSSAACTAPDNFIESENEMNNFSTEQTLKPDLDENVPQIYETATFALG